ncbi:N-acetyltransferase [Ramlibacter henchirensis]
MRRAGDPLCGLPTIGTPLSGFAFRYREADGEQYVYVEDLARRQLAGYTVFNRLVELGRQADLHLRAPHSKYSRHYQRRGIGSAVYRWALERGMCLITGARQSVAAHSLWHSLSARYELGYVDLRDRKLSYLGRHIAPALLADFHARMILLGRGWTLDRFACETGARVDEAAQAVI